MEWGRVEDFLREYAKDLGKVGEYAAVVGRMTGRGLAAEIQGPAVFLEMTGHERRIGMVGQGRAVVSLLGGSQRLLVLAWQQQGPVCRILRHGEHGIEGGEIHFELPVGSGERLRLEKAVQFAVEESARPQADAAAWEAVAQRHWLANEILLGLARAGRRLVRETGNRALRGLHIFNRAMEEIAGRRTQDLHLQDVAEAVGLSARHFARMLQQWSGSGFTEHLLMVRLMEARQRLTSSSDNIETIAGEVGFGSRDHFIRAFRQYFGWTPLQFRKNWRRASEGRGAWEPVLTVADRAPVEWLPATTVARSPEEEAGAFHTLVIANASKEVRVLHRIAADGTASLQGALQPGQAIFLHRDSHGSIWRVVDARGNAVASFRTPKTRAFALVG